MGSVDPPLLPPGVSFDAGAGTTTKGVMAMCSASCSTSMAASARFAGEGSPSKAKVDEASMNGTIAFPAMRDVQRCGEEESKMIKNGGEDERKRRGSI